MNVRGQASDARAQDTRNPMQTVSRDMWAGWSGLDGRTEVSSRHANLGRRGSRVADFSISQTDKGPGGFCPMLSSGPAWSERVLDRAEACLIWSRLL